MTQHLSCEHLLLFSNTGLSLLKNTLLTMFRHLTDNQLSDLFRLIRRVIYSGDNYQLQRLVLVLL